MPVVYKPDGSIDDELPVWVDTTIFVLGVLMCAAPLCVIAIEMVRNYYP